MSHEDDPGVNGDGRGDIGPNGDALEEAQASVEKEPLGLVLLVVGSGHRAQEEAAEGQGGEESSNAQVEDINEGTSRCNQQPGEQGGVDMHKVILEAH